MNTIRALLRFDIDRVYPGLTTVLFLWMKSHAWKDRLYIETIPLFQEEMGESALAHRHAKGIYDHCSGGWCFEVTRRQREYLPEKAHFA